MKKEMKEHLKKLKEEKGKDHIGCDFGIKVFNTKKRKLLPAEIETANAPTKRKGGGKPPLGGGGGAGVAGGFGGQGGHGCVVVTTYF